jgi:hypothetical protein
MMRIQVVKKEGKRVIVCGGYLDEDTQNSDWLAKLRKHREAIMKSGRSGK